MGTSTDANSGTLIRVRRVPLLLRGHALFATRFGYCPVSETGFRSVAGVRDLDTVFLEREAKEVDRRRGDALRRLRSAKGPIEETGGNRLSRFVALSMAIGEAVQYAFLAPSSDRDKLFREVATTAEALVPFLSPSFVPVSGPWTEERVVADARSLLDMCLFICRALPRLCARDAEKDIDAWAALIDALPTGNGAAIRPPAILLGAIRLARGDEPAEERDGSGDTEDAELPFDRGSRDGASRAAAQVSPVPAWPVDTRGQLSLF